MTRIGYARVSTTTQDIDLQIDALEKFGVSKIYSEKLSGKATHKPELYKAIEELQAGDSLVVYRVDRLSRSLRDLLDIVSLLTEKQINLLVTQQLGVDITNPEGRMQFYMSAIISEYERDIMSSRTKDAIRAARSRGKIVGRPNSLSNYQKREISKLYYQESWSVIDIAREFDVSRPTIYRVVREFSAV